MYEQQTNIITKYTGHTVDSDWYVKAIRENDDFALQRLVQRLLMTEMSLADCAHRLREVADSIENNLNAGPNDRVVHLNALGELQSDRTDSYIMLRDALIEQLQAHISTRYAAA